MEELQKRHLKEKNSIQRLQCSTIDKVVAEHDKQKSQEEKLLRKKGYEFRICVDCFSKYLLIFKEFHFRGQKPHI